MKQNVVIWIDLTDFEKWSGTLTGIQRVIYNLSKSFDIDNNVKFFKQISDNQFTEIKFKDIVYQQPAVEITKKLTSLAVLQRKLKTGTKLIVKPFYHKLPIQYKDSLRGYYLNIKHSGSKHVSTETIHPFSSQDIVLVLGASWAWNNATLIKTLSRIKSTENIKIVHLVYDMIPQLFPQFFGPGFGEFYSRHMFETFSVADRLIAISKSTKNDVIKFQKKWNLPNIEIDVIRLGDSINATLTSKKKVNTPHSALKSSGYILCVGTIEIRKNYLLLYTVWRDALTKGIKMPILVIVGRPGWLINDLMYQLSTDPLTKSHIIILSDLKDETLEWLYENCLFTVYPSFYEGWGLPIAESLEYGKLCLASETSSMQEIAGDLLEYFSPYDPAECLKLIQKYLNIQVLEDKENQIKLQYKRTDWQYTYSQAKKSIEKLI